MYDINDKAYSCPVSITLDLFNDRWKFAIIWHLLEGNKRFKELHSIINEITQKTLTVKLKELEEKNIINREVFPEVPLKVVYSLAPIGLQLKPILEQMHKWGIAYAREHGKIIQDNLCDSNLCNK